MNIFTEKFTQLEANQFKSILTLNGASISVPQYTLFQAKGSEFVATFYLSGKFVIQGHKTEEILNLLGISNKIKETKTIVPYPHIGVDESGKGDFFGPLVVAGAVLDEKQAQFFKEMGAIDSKKLNDKKISEIALKIKQNAIFSVVVIGNKKYNELYAKFKNLNKMLAWGHATVIENILSKSTVKSVLCDQFGNENLIKNAIKTKGGQIKLFQMPRAEEDTAVACASILARAEYVKRMDEISRHYGLNFPKGASNLVKNCAKAIVQKFGKDELQNVAKVHFKTYNEVI